MRPVQVGRRRRPDDGAQRLHQRDERQALAAQFDAAAGEDPQAVGRAGCRAERRVEQAALAHARLTADEHDPGLARTQAFDRGPKAGHLPIPSDENGADDLDRHARMLACRTAF